VCTLALGFRLDRRWPVLVAANRDEHLDRPTEGWALRGGASGEALRATPLDRRAGGTWIGVSARGVFAGLTNHYLRFDGYPDPTRRSRGELVERALAAPGAAAAAEALRPLDPALWNPFHLVVADSEGAFLLWYDGEERGLLELGPGLHVVTEIDREGRGARGDLIRARWPADPTLPRLRDLLVQHGALPPASAATCIHGDPLYGTRSSAILRLAPDLAASELYVAEARPCIAPHEDRSDLLLALSRRA